MTNAPEEASDETLAARAAGGDRAAFNDLIRRYKEPLYRFIRRYIGDPDDAYDLLQESFISAWSALRRYDPDRPFAPWLRRIALNKCRDFGRRQTVRRAFLRLFALSVGDPAPSDSEIAEEELEASARLVRLDKAIAGLPAFYKEPLLLTSVQGLSHDEAAKILKTTRKAVEMRLYRARRRLAAMLGEAEEDE